MENFNLLVKDGVVYADSREVAEMTGKRHDHLVRDIDGYIAVLDQNPNLGADDFFVESTYTAGTGKNYKCYLLTKKGCDMVANKMTGEKGVLFTATYIDKFYEMEKQLKAPKVENKQLFKAATAVKDIGDTAEILVSLFKLKDGMAKATAIDVVEEVYNFNLSPIKKLIPAEPNPSTLNPTQIGKRIGKSAKQVNQWLATHGYQIKSGDTWALTDKGMDYGEVRPYKNHGHSGYQIVWSEKIFNLFDKSESVSA